MSSTVDILYPNVLEYFCVLPLLLLVCLEKTADDKLKQYSLEGETHIPGVFGSHTIALLLHQGHFWSNALRIKYGLFGNQLFSYAKEKKIHRLCAHCFIYTKITETSLKVQKDVPQPHLMWVCIFPRA